MSEVEGWGKKRGMRNREERVKASSCWFIESLLVRNCAEKSEGVCYPNLYIYINICVAGSVYIYEMKTAAATSVEGDVYIAFKRRSLI